VAQSVPELLVLLELVDELLVVPAPVPLLLVEAPPAPPPPSTTALPLQALNPSGVLSARTKLKCLIDGAVICPIA